MGARTHIAERAFLSCTTVPVIGARAPASPTFFPAARKECRPRKGRRHGHSGLRIEARCLQRRNSLPTVAQTVVFASRHRASILPLRVGLRGSACVPTGGLPEPAIVVSCIFQMHIPFGSVSIHGGADPHRNSKEVKAVGADTNLRAPCSHARGNFASRRERRLPYDNEFSNKEVDPHTMKTDFQRMWVRCVCRIS